MLICKRWATLDNNNNNNNRGEWAVTRVTRGDGTEGGEEGKGEGVERGEEGGEEILAGRWAGGCTNQR